MNTHFFPLGTNLRTGLQGTRAMSEVKVWTLQSVRSLPINKPSCEWMGWQYPRIHGKWCKDHLLPCSSCLRNTYESVPLCFQNGFNFVASALTWFCTVFHHLTHYRILLPKPSRSTPLRESLLFHFPKLFHLRGSCSCKCLSQAYWLDWDFLRV